MTLERRCQRLMAKLKARTKPNGEARPGFEQNVAVLRAELSALTERIEQVKRAQDGPQ